MSLEAIQESIRHLTGAVNAQIEKIKSIEQRLLKLETPPQSSAANLFIPPSPQNEQDLKDISKLPDSVKELPTFEGNPVQYISWVHSVEGILKDYEIVRNKPIYRAILKSIRQKIRGKADAALISYNIFDDDWSAMKQCLSLHYADKRDLRTLEHQLGTLTQKNSSIDQFYANVNHQFSLIVNKIKTEDYSPDTMDVLIQTYRNRALDVFIRGLNGELSKMLMIQKPQTLPEAYASCLEIQNLNYRNFSIHAKNTNNTIISPLNKLSEFKREQPDTRKIVHPIQYQHENVPLQYRNLSYNIQHNLNNRPPPRPTQPKPPTPMDIDRSVQTRQINYMNRPRSITGKRENDSEGHIRKQQKINYMESREDEMEYDEYVQQYSDYEEEEEIPAEDHPELNFMMGASLAFHT